MPPPFGQDKEVDANRRDLEDVLVDVYGHECKEMAADIASMLSQEAVDDLLSQVLDVLNHPVDEEDFDDHDYS
jgi:hypothetical protein